MRRGPAVLVLLAALVLAAPASATPKFHLKNGLWSIKFQGDDIGGGDFIVKQHRMVTFFEWGMNVECSDGTFVPRNGKRGAEKVERANGTFGPITEGNPGGVAQLFFGGEFTSASKARGQFAWSFNKKPGSAVTCDTTGLRWTAKWSSGDSASG